jgi:transporter family-2 protein
MSSLLLAIIMLCGGMAVAVQPSVNARLAQKVGILESSTVSFAVGTLALLVVVLLVGRGSFKGLAAASWWELSGGFFGAMFVTITILVVPRIGTTAAMGSTIAGQLTTGLILDHFGLFGLVHAPIDAKRMAGIGFLMLGAFLILRR